MADDPIAGSIARVRKEMPDVAGVSIEPQGAIMGTLARGGQAHTSPFGNVTYNPSALQGLSSDELDNVFTHELTHSRQAQREGLGEKAMTFWQSIAPRWAGGRDYPTAGGDPRNFSPAELEGFQAEKDRSLAKGLNLPDPITGERDIMLPDPALEAKYGRKPLQAPAELAPPRKAKKALSRPLRRSR